MHRIIAGPARIQGQRARERESHSDGSGDLLRARQKLGKYRIEQRLSDGPIAAVYKARDTIHGVPVALKIPHEESMTDYFLQDFKHENILPIRDASFIDKYFVITMPLGQESLTDRMKRRVSNETAISFVEQALAAVAHAHRARVIHCDIKPDNLIVFPDNQLRLTDFGFSKVAEHTLKASGSGTVGYIAPEQALGRPMFQSDVFSLGLVIYELLTGVLPEWPYDWPPPHCDRLRRKLKPALVEWLRKAIEVRPEKRYRNAVAMYEEYKRRRNGGAIRKRAAKKSSRPADDPALWQKVLFKQFQRKYRRTLDTRHECSSCSGPIAETMQACPWCGTKIRTQRLETNYPAKCPRCHRGAKLDWRYCAWCYGPGFEVETSRSYPDRRYSARCANAKCRGKLMPFMRYCPWCRTKVRKPWPLPGSKSKCPSCHWGVDRNYWHHCPWCSKALAP
jgi:serine/threonine protein kinase